MSDSILPLTLDRTQTLNHSSTGGGLKLLRLWIARAQQRRQLAQLSDELLRDIGVSRAAALAESRKPFWKS